MGLLGYIWFLAYRCLLSAFKVLFRMASVASGAVMPCALSHRDNTPALSESLDVTVTERAVGPPVSPARKWAIGREHMYCVLCSSTGPIVLLDSDYKIKIQTKMIKNYKMAIAEL